MSTAPPTHCEPHEGITKADTRQMYEGLIARVPAASPSERTNEARQRGTEIVLFDKEDWELALHEEHSFAEILDVKLRRLAVYGDPNYSFATHLRLQRL